MAAMGEQQMQSQTSGDRKRKAFDDATAPEVLGAAAAGVPEEAGAFPNKAPSSRVKEKHSATEKRRRDRIAEGLASLREVVVPVKEREDQAGFLRSAADYIRQLQAVLQHFSDVGFVRLLPEEAQWNVRALLAPVASSAAAANAAPAAQQPAPAAVAAAGQLPPAAQPGQLQPTGIELPGLMAQLLHHMATSGPQAGQLPGAPMGDLGAFAPDPQQHLPQQQQQYQAQLQALAQKAHELAPAVPDGSAWEFDGVDPHQHQGQVQQPGQGLAETHPPIPRF